MRKIGGKKKILIKGSITFPYPITMHLGMGVLLNVCVAGLNDQGTHIALWEKAITWHKSDNKGGGRELKTRPSNISILKNYIIELLTPLMNASNLNL